MNNYLPKIEKPTVQEVGAWRYDITIARTAIELKEQLDLTETNYQKQMEKISGQARAEAKKKINEYKELLEKTREDMTDAIAMAKRPEDYPIIPVGQLPDEERLAEELKGILSKSASDWHTREVSSNSEQYQKSMKSLLFKFDDEFLKSDKNKLQIATLKRLSEKVIFSGKDSLGYQRNIKRDTVAFSTQDASEYEWTEILRFGPRRLFAQDGNYYDAFVKGVADVDVVPGSLEWRDALMWIAKAEMQVEAKR